MGAYQVQQQQRVKACLRAKGKCTYTDFEPRIQQLDAYVKDLRRQGWEIDVDYRGDWRTYLLITAGQPPKLQPPTGTFPGEAPEPPPQQEQLFGED